MITGSQTNSHHSIGNYPLNPFFYPKKNNSSWTHSYHSYPAKFYPSLVTRLLKEHVKPKSVVADVFAGCGTTLLESKIAGIKSVGIDINPVTSLITYAKINPIPPKVLQNKWILLKKILSQPGKFEDIQNYNLLLTKYFSPENLGQLLFIKKQIKTLNNKKIQTFFFCALSNILKKTSLLEQNTVKLRFTKSPNPKQPIKEFIRQVEKMLIKNQELYNYFKEKNLLYTKSKLFIKSAKKTGLDTGSIDIVLTSPPYATSYEYADIHLLSALFFDFTQNPIEFRKNFIGTSYSKKIKAKKIHSQNLEILINKLSVICPKSSNRINTYFSEMHEVFKEINRILKPQGTLCLTSADTVVNKIPLPTTEIFIEILISLGFTIKKISYHVLKRKQLPSQRDLETGKFTSNKEASSIYSKEYIIIAQKN
jgi:DNA modification methylase